MCWSLCISFPFLPDYYSLFHWHTEYLIQSNACQHFSKGKREKAFCTAYSVLSILSRFLITSLKITRMFNPLPTHSIVIIFFYVGEGVQKQKIKLTSGILFLKSTITGFDLRSKKFNKNSWHLHNCRSYSI